MSASEEDDSGNPINSLCSNATKVKEWKEFLARPEAIPAAIPIAANSKELYNFAYLLEACEEIPEWQKVVPVDSIPLALERAAQDADLRKFAAILKTCTKVSSWQAVVPVAAIQTALARKDEPTVALHLGPSYKSDFVASGKRMIAEIIAQVAEWSTLTGTAEILPIRDAAAKRREGSKWRDTFNLKRMLGL